MRQLFPGATATEGHVFIPFILQWLMSICSFREKRLVNACLRKLLFSVLLWGVFHFPWTLPLVSVAVWDKHALLILSVSAPVPFRFQLTFLYLSDCSFPLLLFHVFQSLVYSRSTGERDMFAHSLSRRGRQKAGNQNEQIYSCKVKPTEGNCGMFAGVEMGIRRPCCDHRCLPFYNYCISLLAKAADAFSRYLYCNFFFYRVYWVTQRETVCSKRISFWGSLIVKQNHLGKVKISCLETQDQSHTHGWQWNAKFKHTAVASIDNKVTNSCISIPVLN